MYRSMYVKDLKIIKQDERGIVFDCDSVMFVRRGKNSVTADHIHDEEGEIIYLIKGTIDLTVGKETIRVNGPKRVEIPRAIYHKIVAVTDIEFLKAIIK